MSTLSNWDIKEARNDAFRTIRQADQAARGVADLIAGRLKVARIEQDTLRKLKEELKDYNMHTGKWK